MLRGYGMAQYTEQQLRVLRDRWKEHERELKALLPVLKVYLNWHGSDEYKALMEGIGPLSGEVETVERDLRGVDLSHTQLIGAYLGEANLFSAELSGANLLGADLSGADLQEVRMSGANLIDANLNRVDLRGAVLNEANLMGARLREANLNGVKLRGANLIGADLRGIRFFGGADFAGAKWWGSEMSEGSQFCFYLQDYFTRRNRTTGRFSG